MTRSTLAPAALALLALAALLPEPRARAQVVAFQPVINTFPDGVSLTATPVVSADRRYVRLGVQPQFLALDRFDTFAIPGAVGGGGIGGGLGGGLGGIGGGAGFAAIPPAGPNAGFVAGAVNPTGIGYGSPFGTAVAATGTPFGPADAPPATVNGSGALGASIYRAAMAGRPAPGPAGAKAKATRRTRRGR